MASAFKSFVAWYDKLASFNVENLFVRKREPGPPRTVYVNQELPPDYFDHKGRIKKEHIYSTNQVITSKYTIVTFLPRNLLEQFRRIANVFFLGIAILQFFSIFSTVSPGLVILPLLIVLAITALKDGYEDIKRHQSDRSVNHSIVRILSGGGWANHNAMTAKSKTFVPGIPGIKRNPKKRKLAANPANPPMEVEMLSQGAPQGAPPGAPPEPIRPVRTMSQVYSMTTVTDDDATEFSTDDAIDHEGGGVFHSRSRKRPHWKKRIWEDLKVGDFVKIIDNEPIPADILICSTSEDENVAFVETKNLDGETNLKSRMACPALTHFQSAYDCADKANAFRIECDRPDTNLYKLNAAVLLPNGDRLPVDTQMVLLRGTVLRNTAWIVGVVLFTGEDTKIVLNSGGTPSKRSKVERQMNPQVFINLIILAVMAVACGIADALIEQHYFPLGAPWLFDDTQSDDNPHINGLITWAFALITFQNIVPISLYISIEFVRTCQALFIYFDKEMYYAKTDQATLARSWNLSDDLGQIEYIFSDKTGTLTQNSMVFRQCSIGGKSYKGDPEIEDDELVKEPLPIDSDDKIEKLSRTTSASASASGSGSRPATGQRVPKFEDVPNPLTAKTVKLSGGALTHFRDTNLMVDLNATSGAEPDSENASHAHMLNAFWSTLALCHTALVSIDPETGAIEYKAQSPDETALVQAAADVGFIFRGRDREILNLQTPFEKELERYELLNILEFNSTRKRMSVIVRKLSADDNRIFLLTKGADNVIFERLKPGSDELKSATEDHLNEFASEGLRTLTLAYRVLPVDEYEAWAEKYQEATTVLEDREERIDAISNEIEHSLILLGATAIEDRLQDGVPETIADLKEAGIKVWVATGDKLETAIAIGHSTNLIGHDDNIIIVRGGEDDRAKSIYVQMQTALERFFPEVEIPQEAHDPELAKDDDGLDLRRVNTGVSSLVGHDNGDRPGGFVLVIDGSALTHALGDDPHRQLLLRLATQCDAVICCRVSPLQKALVVRLVKDGLGSMTLAIGDGANDVSMIQAADVGVGISGEEGLQAVNSSDYSIAQFRFLKRLLLVHGHWSYARNGNMIVNFFYKNVIGIGVLWWFQIYCGWSSQYVFEYTYLLFWNSFWTIAPPIGTGLFDRVADDDILMAMPSLYGHSRRGEYFTLRIFLIYMLEGFVQSAIIFFIILYSYFSPSSRTDGYDVYIYEFSTTMAISAVMVACFFNGLNTNVWTGWVFFAVFLGIVLIWGYTAIYSVIAPGWFSTPIYGNDHYLFESAYFWLSLPIAIVLPLLPRYLAKAYEFAFMPSDIDRVRWLRKIEPTRDFTKNKEETLARMRGPMTFRRRKESKRRESHEYRASRTDMSTGLVSVHHGFDFSTEENGVAMRRMQSNLSERQNSIPFKRRKRDRVLHALPLPRSLRRKKPPLESDQTPLN